MKSNDNHQPTWRKCHNTPQNYKKKKGHIFTMISETSEDYNLSIRTIVQRSINGIPASNIKERFYNPEGEGINPKRLDLVDIQLMQMESNAILNSQKIGKKKADELIKAKELREDIKAQIIRRDGAQKAFNTP